MAAAVFVPFAFHWCKNNPWDRLAGELSYPLYLVHYFVVSFSECSLHQKHEFSSSAKGLFVLVVSLPWQLRFIWLV